MKNNLYIVWNESNNTEVSILDEQHRAIVSMINTLHYSINNQEESEIVESIFITLEQYIKFHFHTEEEIMEKLNYPDLKEHTAQHEQLAADTRKVFLEVEIDNDPEVLLQFLKNWWLKHICIEDRKYSEHMKRQK